MVVEEGAGAAGAGRSSGAHLARGEVAGPEDEDRPPPWVDARPVEELHRLEVGEVGEAGALQEGGVRRARRRHVDVQRNRRRHAAHHPGRAVASAAVRDEGGAGGGRLRQRRERRVGLVRAEGGAAGGGGGGRRRRGGGADLLVVEGQQARGVVLLAGRAREVERHQVLVDHRVVHVLRPHREDGELHPLPVGALEQRAQRAQRDVRHLLARRVLALEARERHRGALQLPRHLEAPRVAAGERRLGAAAVAPPRRHGVQHVLRRQLEAARRLHVARRAAAELAARLLELRPRRGEELARDARPLVEVLVAAVDDGVDLQLRQVALPQRELEVELLVHRERHRRRVVEQRLRQRVVARRRHLAPAGERLELHLTRELTAAWRLPAIFWQTVEQGFHFPLRVDRAAEISGARAHGATHPSI